MEQQKKVIDDHCTNEWAVKAASPWADFEHSGIAKLKSDPAHEVYSITPAQLADETSWDATVAEHIVNRRFDWTPADLAPLPILGIPGWWQDNDLPEFYQNERYFRRERRRQQQPTPPDAVC